MNYLTEVYIEQVGVLAGEHGNDCGAASILMKAQTYKVGTDLTVNQVYNQIVPVGDRPLYMSELRNWLIGKGMQCDWQTLDTPAKIYDVLYQKKPITLLLHYGTLVDAKVTQFIGFRAGHFLECNGIELDNAIIHDPYHSDGKGTFQSIPIATLMKSLKDCSIDGNPQYQGLVPALSIRDLSNPNTV